MLLEFQRGDSSRPRGHALAYYRDAQTPGDIYATYLIVPPIAIDLAKYMPPMFATKISLADMETLSAVPLPPVPERVASLEHLRRLAESRDDDIVCLGTLSASDIQAVLTGVAEAAQAYLRAYNAYAASLPAPAPGSAPAIEESGASVQDVLYGLMSDRDKLAELAKLLGKLRYAVEGRDRPAIEEAAGEMGAVGAHLAAKYRVGELVTVAKLPGDRGRRLAELHVARCYKVCEEDYLAAERIDAEIREIESRP